MQIVTAVLVFASSLASDPQGQCSNKHYRRAEATLASAAKDWRDLARHREAFGKCDDGALAEGYSDAVVTLLAKRWSRFELFARLAVGQPAFRHWAIRHIDASASTDDLAQVVHNSARCTGSPDVKHLCREVHKAAVDALNE